MTTKDTIYNAANRDARTNCIPLRNENGEFIFTVGQREILNDDKNSQIPLLHKELKRKEERSKECVEEMLYQGKLYKTSSEDLKLKESELQREEAEESLLKEEILLEKERLMNRNIIPPEKPAHKVESKIEPKPKVLKINWKKYQILGSALVSFMVVEAFLGLSLWDSSREQKDIVQSALRIAASAILFGSVYFAASKYKTTKKKRYAIYIVYGMISLIILFLVALVTGFFFPQYIEGGTNVNGDMFNLNGSLIETESAPNDIIAFLLKYDFIIAVIAIIFYKSIVFLDTGEIRKSKNEQKDEIENTPSKEKVNPAFIHLLGLHKQLDVQITKVTLLKKELGKLKTEPTDLSLEIKSFLEQKDTEIKNLGVEISDLKTQLEKRYRHLDCQLKQYDVDFKDVLRTLPAASFVTPQYPTKQDINQYYNIKNI